MATKQLTILNEQNIDISGLPATVTGVTPSETGSYPTAISLNSTTIYGPSVATATLDAGETYTPAVQYQEFSSTKVYPSNPTIPTGKYITDAKIDETSILKSVQGATIPYNTDGVVHVETEDFLDSSILPVTVPAGHYVESVTINGDNILDNQTAQIPYGASVTPTVTTKPIPSVSATFESTLDNTKPYTDVHFVVTHSNGTSESVTGDYTFQDGDVVSLAGTEYETSGPTYDSPTLTVPPIGTPVIIQKVNVNGAPNVTTGAVVPITEGAHVDIVTEAYEAKPVSVTIPKIPVGEVVTNITLDNGGQGTTVELAEGNYEIDINTVEFAIDIDVEYTDTTEPMIKSAQTPDQNGGWHLGQQGGGLLGP